MKTFVSSACIEEKDLEKNILRFEDLGYDSIELTGGIRFEPEIESLLESLKTNESVSIQFHNYSPPVEKDFVLNLASLNPDTYQRSLAHVQSTLKMSRRLGFDKYAVHAGFYIPVEADELGKLIKKRSLFDKKVAYEQFVNTVNELYSEYSDILYIENNVVSSANFAEYQENPFMLTCADEYFEMKERIPRLRLLLDFAHLKVTCKTLGLSFQDEVSRLVNETDYVHISDNDGNSDSNQGLVEDSEMYEVLKTVGLASKTVTLEVYSGVEDLQRSYHIVNQLQ